MAEQNDTSSNSSNNNNNNNTDSITVTGKPSTGQANKYYEYKEYTKTWANWCPFCKKTGTLTDTPKGLNNVPEHELTCDTAKGGCDADFDITTGADKSGSYRAYLKDACTGAQNTPSDIDTSIGDCEGTDNNSESNTTTPTTGSAVRIPDITFYGLIKQIMGAVDANLIIGNNMAYLLSFKDIYEYRNQFDEYIPKIELNDVLSHSLEKNFAPEGFYNAVEVTYKDGIVEYQNDVLVKQYGKNVFYYTFPEDDEETAKAKADALLAAHIRDYSTNIQLSVFFNENITAGSWVKVRKTLTNITGKTRKERQQMENMPENGVIETKHKGITIQNLVEKTITDKTGMTKYVQSVTDELGNMFDIEVEKNDYELFFVQGFTCRWDRHNSLIMDLQLKYGPDTPADPINASIGSMGATGGGGAAGITGGQAEDINEFVAQCVGNATTEREKAEAVHEGLRDIIRYDYYECSKYSTPSECLKNAAHLNCADTSRLTTACMKAAGLQAEVVWGPGHFWTQIQIDGQGVYSDLTGCTGCRSRRALGEVWNNMKHQKTEGDNPHC